MWTIKGDNIAHMYFSGSLLGCLMVQLFCARIREHCIRRMPVTYTNEELIPIPVEFFVPGTVYPIPSFPKN